MKSCSRARYCLPCSLGSKSTLASSSRVVRAHPNGAEPRIHPPVTADPTGDRKQGGSRRREEGGMASVETIKGPVDVSRLGRTLMHEHVFILNPEMLENYYADWWDEDERVRDAAAKLTALKQRGIDTIVDPTVLGLGRNIPRVQRIAELVDINII